MVLRQLFNDASVPELTQGYLGREIKDWLFVCCWFVVSICPLMAFQSRENEQSTLDFVRDVEPIFREHCWTCHGEDHQEGGLRLDVRSDALAGGDSGRAIVSRDAAASRLWNYVAGNDPDHIMPPDSEPLDAKLVDTLRQWIESGAVWPDSAARQKLNEHWAYQPLRQGILPDVTDDDWCLNGIDRFVLNQLDELGLQPSPQADRYTLVRRLYLDLLGLLPSIEAVEQFVSDSNPDAYELLVDRLLGSPHFGERWGRHWLDKARYADSDGYEKDNPRPDAYRWRDWVIEAYNDDTPFDQFTIEQLAGDLLANSTAQQRLATAFHRQTLTNTEGGTDQEQFRIEACFDRTETTGTVWLGLTLGCARCHSHKYDAISQRDYYQLFAFFNNADEQTFPVPKSVADIADYGNAKARYDEQLKSLEQQLHERQAELWPALAEWEKQIRPAVEQAAQSQFQRGDWSSLTVSSDVAGSKLALQDDGSFLSSGDNPPSANYLIQGQVGIGQYKVLRLKVLADASLPNRGPGRSGNGNFVLSEIALESSASVDFSLPVVHRFSIAKFDTEQDGYPAIDAFDGRLDTGWAIRPQVGKDHWLELQLSEPLEVTQPIFVRVLLKQQYGSQHTIGRFLVTLQSDWSPDEILPKSILDIVNIQAQARDELQRQALMDFYSPMDGDAKTILDAIAELKKLKPDEPIVKARVLAQRSEALRQTFVLRRGDFLTPLHDVTAEPGGLSTLPPMITRQSQGDRLDLARWLVSPNNPLTPRVTVNSVWNSLFGRGIVSSTSDFGVRGAPPTHPELLDWLAGQFAGLEFYSTNGQIVPWSRKSLIKLIVMSATYRQSSRASETLLQVDPQNQRLARQNRLRVEGEIVRDISLDAAGLLTRAIGGPSVYPALPAGIAELSYAGNFKWNESDGADRYRRGMYTFFKRTSPHPNLITFDCPDANLTCVDRDRSNTPLQALVTLNNDSFTEAAQVLAKRTLVAQVDSDSDRLTYAFRTCLARPPSIGELQELSHLLDAARRYYSDHIQHASSLVGEYPAQHVSVSESAAWVATLRVLINLDEFITRE